ncbi:hypothetical protein EG328_006960, partial [Venturia inaequalis]
MAIHEPRAETPQAAIACCFRDHRYSDLLIQCGGTNFRVHKIVVCPQCKFLENACKEEWEKKTMHENVEMTHIELSDDSPLAVNALIEWLYNHDYTVLTKEDENTKDLKDAWNSSEILGHIQVYVIAEKYDIKGLRDLAEKNIRRTLGPTKTNPHFHNAIREIYDNTGADDALRQQMAGFASLHAKEEFATDGKFKGLMMEIPEFGADVAHFLCGGQMFKGLVPAIARSEEEENGARFPILPSSFTLPAGFNAGASQDFHFGTRPNPLSGIR